MVSSILLSSATSVISVDSTISARLPMMATRHGVRYEPLISVSFLSGRTLKISMLSPSFQRHEALLSAPTPDSLKSTKTLSDGCISAGYDQRQHQPFFTKVPEKLNTAFCFAVVSGVKNPSYDSAHCINQRRVPS